MLVLALFRALYSGQKYDTGTTALPTRYGGLGMHILTEKAPRDYSASKLITEPVVQEIKNQGQKIQSDSDNQYKISLIRMNLDNFYKGVLEELKSQLSPSSKRSLELAAERGSSNWLATLPLKDQGFVLNRSEFTDALNIRYYRQLKGVPDTCPCGHSFTITHALNCKRGGFVHMRHDNLRDFNAGLLSKVLTDVQKEPPLIPIVGENVSGNSADAARVDIRARGFWRPAQSAYFDVRVTNPLSESAMKTALSRVYDSHEKEKT